MQLSSTFAGIEAADVSARLFAVMQERSQRLPWGAAGGRLQSRRLLLCEPSPEPATRPARPGKCPDRPRRVLHIHFTWRLALFSLHRRVIQVNRRSLMPLE